MVHERWRVGALLPCVLSLAACVSTLPELQGENDIFRARETNLLALNGWHVEGRIAFKFEDEGGTGAMTWKQDAGHVTFSFRGPLGAASFNVEGTPPDLLLRTGDGESQVLTDPDSELRARFGWSAPFASLRFWMLGIPDPASNASVRVDADGLLREMQQAGWAISYDRYHSNAPQLPRKLTLLRDDVRIRVIVDSWNFTEQPG